MEPEHYATNYSQQRKAGSGRGGPPKESTSFGYPVPVNRVNIHASNIIWTQQVLFGNIYVFINTNMPAVTIDEQKGHEFE